jgi:8-hydroxy-5-deazaflavin:NADPH oxidoreductase
MRVAILGAGSVGRAIGAGLETAGHEVHFATRGEPRVDEGVTLESYDRAVDGADVTVLAVPGLALETTLATFASLLDGRLLADATNVLHTAHYHQLDLFPRYVPTARVARAWCAIGATTMATPTVDGQASDLVWCGLEGDDIAVMASLIADTGLRPVRLGGLEAAGLVDATTRLVLSLIFEGGWPHGMGIKLLGR